MMQSNDKIKELFSAKLANYEPQPPLGMWDKIDGSLAVGAAKTAPVRKITLRRTLSVASGIAAMLAIAFLLLTYMNENNTSSNISIAGSSPITVDKPVNTPEPVNVQTAPQQPLYAKAFVRSNQARQPATVEIEVEAAGSESEYAPSDESRGDTPVRQQEQKPAAKPQDDELQRKIEAFEKAGQNNTLLPDAAHSDAGCKKGLTVSMSGSSGFSELTDKKVPAPNKFLKYALASEANSSMAAAFTETQRAILPGPHVKIEHRQPISFGLKIDKRLNNRFSVETGLVCTYLSSRLTPANSNIKVESNLKFYYVGLPLSLNYTFAKLGKAEFQFSVGGMIQKDISGKIVGDQEFIKWYNEIENTTIENHISDKISQAHPQLSIMANTGVTYPLYKRLNMYATVGGAYYFDADNEYRTVYSDKQLQLDVNVGLKLKF